MRSIDSPLTGVAHKLDAELHRVGRRCDIYHFRSSRQRQGPARTVLRELRRQFRLIRVVGIGGESNPDYSFWRQMADEELVDVLLDDVGHVMWQRSH
jgi:hypothetical protein